MSRNWKWKWSWCVLFLVRNFWSVWNIVKVVVGRWRKKRSRARAAPDQFIYFRSFCSKWSQQLLFSETESTSKTESKIIFCMIAQILLMQWKKYKDAMYTHKEIMQYILNFHLWISKKVTFCVLKNVGVWRSHKDCQLALYCCYTVKWRDTFHCGSSPSGPPLNHTQDLSKVRW